MYVGGRSTSQTGDLGDRCVGRCPGPRPGGTSITAADDRRRTHLRRARAGRWAHRSLDQRPCRAQLTRLGQAVARRLAAAVDTGEPIQVGAAYACPFESGARVELFFQFAHRVVETVSVDLSGCRWIDAPARVSRFTPPDMQLELDTLAPPGWRLTR